MIRPIHRLHGLIVLAFSAILFIAQPVWAQADLASFLSPVLGAQKFSVDYRLAHTGDRTVQDQEVDLSGVRHELDLLIPIRGDSTREFSLILNAEHRYIDTSAVLPDTGQAFPEDLKDLGFGGVYRQKAANGWIWGGHLLVNSPSDDPFHSRDEIALSAGAFTRIPRGSDQAWLLSLFYSDTNRGAPLPGVAWQYFPRSSWRLLLGLPVSSIYYQPTDRLSLSLTGVLPRTVKFQAAWRFHDRLEAFTGFSSDHDAYFLADRANSDNLLFIYENRAFLGLGIDVTDRVKVETVVSRVFDQMVFEGENYGDRHQNRLDIEDGTEWTLRIKLNL